MFVFLRDFLHTGAGGHSTLEIKMKIKRKTGILMSFHVCSLLSYLASDKVKPCLDLFSVQHTLD